MTDDQPSINSDWIDTDAHAPVKGEIVQVRAKDYRGFYIIPFAVIFHDDKWWNARTKERLDCYIAGWRPMNGLKSDAG